MDAPPPADPAAFAAAHAAVCALCDHFDAERPHFTGPDYKEAEARVQFITPFFRALGWDVDNSARRSVYEKDVVIEKRENVAGHALSADYAFRRPGSHLTAFFVEAKKPSSDIRNHQDCYQAVQYGWNAKTPLVVLTNFAQLFVLDARAEPDEGNSTRFILRHGGAYKHSDFRDADRFTELWGLLARPNVAAGSLDRAAAALPRLSGRLHRDDLFARGTGPVDETFLAEMEGWRAHLARQFKKDNHALDGERLTALTQRILDRLVFLRFLEDRGIEHEFTFARIGKGGSAWNDFLTVSKRLNARYNGILYKPDPSGCEDESLVVDEGAFASVASRFAPENSKYLFNSISVTILGSIYERFLGNVIVSRNKTAIVEPKPEVRKAGGVYYTPDYIVRYIVEQTVGRAIEGRKPEDIAKLRFADIACGSGSFLVEVFACLIRYHLKWYLADGAAKWTKKGILRARERDDESVLTLAEKRRLLLNNVYGVDLDPQAVEVTQLSLYLRLMEDESFPSTQLLFDEERRALLPDLRENILCGNSLIGRDIADLFGLSIEEEERIRPLEFRGHFGKVFSAKGGGFDAIVGNPPYIRIQFLGDMIPQTPEYCRTHYASAGQGNYDLYVVFIERALSLLNASGTLGYIVPHKFFNARYGARLRGLLTAGQHVRDIVHFGHQQVFDGPTTYTCLLFLGRQAQPQLGFFAVDDLPQWRESIPPLNALPQLPVGEADWSFVSGGARSLMDRLKAECPPLSEVTDRIFQGLKTSADKIYIVEERERADGKVRVFSPEKQADYWLEADLLHPLVKGGDSRRFRLTKTERLILFPYVKRDNGAVTLLTGDELAAGYPLTWKYLTDNRKYLERREDGKMKGPAWFAYIYPKALDVMSLPKLFTPDIAPVASFSEDATGELFFTGGVSGGYGLLAKKGWVRRYLLGLLNSKLLEWMLSQTATQMRGGWYSFESRFISHLPIRPVVTSAEKSLHDRIVKLVGKVMAAKNAEAEATDSGKQEYWRRTAEADERHINALVYELYGLSDDEIALVEGDA